MNSTIEQAWILQYWPIISDVGKVIGVIVVAWWTLSKYREEKEKDRQARLEEKKKDRDARIKDSALKLHELFNHFYLEPAFSQLRLNLDFNYEEKLRPLIVRMVENEQSPFSSDEKQSLCDLDTLLKSLEVVLHLKKHAQISGDDCDVLFKYWFKQLERPERECLREYIRKFGFETVAEKIAADMQLTTK